MSVAMAAKAINFEQYDTTNLKQAAKPLALPDSVLASPWKAGYSLAEVEWSTDNNHALLQHIYQGGSEFLIFDRQTPAS